MKTDSKWGPGGPKTAGNGPVGARNFTKSGQTRVKTYTLGLKLCGRVGKGLPRAPTKFHRNPTPNGAAVGKHGFGSAAVGPRRLQNAKCCSSPTPGPKNSIFVPSGSEKHIEPQSGLGSAIGNGDIWVMAPNVVFQRRFGPAGLASLAPVKAHHAPAKWAKLGLQVAPGRVQCVEQSFPLPHQPSLGGGPAYAAKVVFDVETPSFGPFFHSKGLDQGQNLKVCCETLWVCGKGCSQGVH